MPVLRSPRISSGRIDVRTPRRGIVENGWDIPHFMPEETWLDIKEEL
jgi:hypothetical protein